MGRGGDSGRNDESNFGNFANQQDFKNLFGGGNVFNLGAGSSTNNITSSGGLDLGNTNKLESSTGSGGGGGGFGLDMNASVGVGVGGGSGSGGTATKEGSSLGNASLGGQGGQTAGKDNTLLIVGIAAAAAVAIIAFNRKGKKRK